MNGFNDIALLIREIMNEFSDDLPEDLREQIKRKRIRASGDLLNEIDSQVIGKAAQDLSQLVLQFRKHGRFQEMKNVRHGQKGPPPNRLKAWIEAIGLDKFKFIPGYKGSPKSMFEIKNASMRLAIAISRSKRNTDRKKARKFYIRNVYKKIYSDGGLFDQILDGVGTEMLKDMKTFSIEDFVIKS